MSKLIELENQVASLTKLLAETRGELYLVQQDELGVHVGDMVRRKGGKLYRVETFYFFSYHKKPWIRGRLQKKDGGLAINRTMIFDDWEKQ